MLLMKKAFFALACTVLLFSCKRDDDDCATPTQVMRYEQTYCADPWQSDATDAATLTNLRRYLDARNLYHTAEYIRAEKPAELCNACACHSGKVIYVSVLPSQQQDYAAMGFTR